MPFGDEDVAVASDEDVVRLPEVLGAGAPAGFAKSQEKLAGGAELEHLVAFRRSRRGRAVAGAAASTTARTRAVGYPHVAIAIDENAVR